MREIGQSSDRVFKEVYRVEARDESRSKVGSSKVSIKF